MTIKEKVMGRRYDGGKSPLAGAAPILPAVGPGKMFEARTGNYRGGGDLENTLQSRDDSLLLTRGKHPMHEIAPEVTENSLANSAKAIADLDRIKRGRGETLSSPSVIGIIKDSFGIDPSTVCSLPEGKRRKLHNRLVDHMQRAFKERTTPRPIDDAETERRNEVWERVIVPWSRGPLRLERPQGSSLHHLIQYDVEHTSGMWARSVKKEDYQIFLVEHDWAKVVDNLQDEEWRLPFPNCCFEFRISGVRVLTFCYQREDSPMIDVHSVFGAENVWLPEDYRHEVRGLVDHAISLESDDGSAPVQMPRVNAMIVEQIRGACMMLDAAVCEKQMVRASVRLNESRVTRGKAPLSDYHVVRLRNVHERAARSEDPGHSGREMPRHWRRGHWRHFTNDQGSIVRKTWINKQLIRADQIRFVDKEYRL